MATGHTQRTALPPVSCNYHLGSIQTLNNSFPHERFGQMCYFIVILREFGLLTKCCSGDNAMGERVMLFIAQ